MRIKLQIDRAMRVGRSDRPGAAVLDQRTDLPLRQHQIVNLLPDHEIAAVTIAVAAEAPATLNDASLTAFGAHRRILAQGGRGAGGRLLGWRVDPLVRCR